MGERANVKTKAKEAPPPPPPPEEAKPNVLDRFTPKQIHRRQIKNAPYNPRFITDTNREKLRASLEGNGNLGALIWNERTGNLVGGHQRLALFDDANGTDNYLVWVDAVDLDERQEVEANIALNNPEAQGQYDFDKLVPLMAVNGVRIEAMGFSHADAYAIMGDNFAERPAEEVNALAEKLANKRNQIADVKTALGKRDGHEFMIVFVCRDPEERDRVLSRMGLPLDQWQSVDALTRLLS